MFDNFQYAYLIGGLFFALVWLILFFYRRDLRKEMLVMSLVVAPLGPLSQIFYLRDYWQPQLFNGLIIGFEDVLFTFAIGGITAVCYEEVFGSTYAERHTTPHLRWMLVAVVIGLAIMLVGNILLGFNSIYVSIFAFLLLGAAVILSRHDLLKDAFYSGLLVGFLMLLFYIFFTTIFEGVIEEWWLLENLSGIIILGAPLEELLWGFSWGFVAGPAYEFINGLKFKR